MLVGVCDFPGSYTFPPTGYGGIERWLWAVATGARAAGADVHLLGPAWRQDLGPEWHRDPIRLEDTTPGSPAARRLRSTGYDLLVVGHEYPSLPAWRRTRAELDCDVATFQHNPDFQHATDAFDGVRTRLYCYSPEMLARYTRHRPVRELAVHLGLHESEPPSIPGRDLAWVGRIDEQKAPHLAARAAQILGRRIRLVGPVFDPAYVERHGKLLTAEHVEWAGELGGPDKTAAFRDAAVFVYTHARSYVEAGAAVFGESLRAGTPVAALTWREGTCAEAALCDRTGTTAVLPPEEDDEAAAQALAVAIERTGALDHVEVQAIGLRRFDPRRHFEALATRPC
ncbi:glycosyltransferase [Streptomyces aidingensis]|uniref:Glycosyltransferase involved in cell wall bisynthesis n=1 Tax=Streptomyces aidingensis TaxID=910347 RepID=A0A1I1KN29_9ACTN|nr:glycosyltransferase [Streptomyces aidingensis]SFC61692.1 Glycosyltransferase involved in cell wall bisynthesis [Streptomyces aidingensis]